ncbi:Hypothetical protein FKW44_010493 [Caligus rogercresseyi]|uniref:Uncharacterized protein n=1 Tax=Caligus rogercresseyi TaxID=217165 RepID=A0A7T8HHP7_CALRO|nr:Hypothetical protein FKW44_010493 [Caligus rogercresseyi]
MCQLCPPPHNNCSPPRRHELAAGPVINPLRYWGSKPPPLDPRFSYDHDDIFGFQTQQL